MEQMPVSSSPVKRGENLTDEQRQFLLEKIETYKDPLTDKRNDLQTIHRKKHAWERITETFNTKFSNLPRKRSIQQIQTWYKNEKARCRRVLIRQRLRQQSHSMSNESLDFRINENPPSLHLGEKEAQGNAKISTSKVKEIVSTEPQIYRDDCDPQDLSDMKYDYPEASSNRHVTIPNSISSQTCQSFANFQNHVVRDSINNLTIPSLLALTSKNDSAEFNKTTQPVFHNLSKVDVTNSATFLSFLRDQTQNRDHPFNADRESSIMSPGDTQQTEHLDAAKNKNAEWELTNDKVSESTNISDSHKTLKCDNASLDNSIFQRKIFDKKMKVLSIKEDCIRKYYDKKESVLKIKEQYYQLKIQMLRDQVVAMQTKQNSSPKRD